MNFLLKIAGWFLALQADKLMNKVNKNVGKKLDKDTIQKIKDMRAMGIKVKDICEKLGVNKNTVSKYSKKEK